MNAQPELTGSTPIGRLHHVVLDSPQPLALAEFYSALTGMPITYRSDDWVVVAGSARTAGLAFQLAVDHQPPSWPDPNRPQQFHLDIMVDDREVAAKLVEDLGATRLNTDGDATIFADPSGHPFCLIDRPSWAPPVSGGHAAEPGRADAPT